MIGTHNFFILNEHSSISLVNPYYMFSGGTSTMSKRSSKVSNKVDCLDTPALDPLTYNEVKWSHISERMGRLVI